MSPRRGHRVRTGDPSRSCRAWADGLDDEEVAELRRRVEQDAVVIVALALAHSSGGGASPSERGRRSGE